MNYSSNPSLQLLFPNYLSVHLFAILSINVTNDHGHCPDTAANCTLRTENRAMINRLSLRNINYISHVNYDRILHYCNKR